MTLSRAQSAEGAADPEEQISRVDPEAVKQGRVLLGVDLLRQLALGAVGHGVLAPATKLVDDLLPVDLHLDTPSGSSRSLVQTA